MDSRKFLVNPDFAYFVGFYVTDYEMLSDIILVRNSYPRVMNRAEQPQKGAGIYAAYCFFKWELKW